MMNVVLSDSEYLYLLDSTFLTEDLRNSVVCAQQVNDSYIITISEDQSDQLRDILGEQLQLIGFDKDYNLTTEGKVIDSMIDKFFVC